MSGAITITPGKQFGPGELETRAGLNQLGTPTGQVDEGAITARELDATTNRTLSFAGGHNLLCNGDFEQTSYFLPGGLTSLTGVINSNHHDHDYGSVNRWVTANDANRVVTLEPFALGQTEVPDSPFAFLRWSQTAPLAIDPGYLGQRLENVVRLAGMKLTLSVYVRSNADVSVIPKARQFFGTSGASADVVIAGSPTMLPANVWTKLVATFDVPSIAGKVVTVRSFTEFRIEMPHGIAFQIDFSHAQLELGAAPSRFDQKGISDIADAQRYYEVLQMVLSNAITVWTPFVMARAAKPYGAATTLLPASGTGGVVGNFGVNGDCFIQTNNHSSIQPARLLVNTELYDGNASP